ncbi:uncharacterized protein N7469_005265 [Penicillium citrinum]|uniref:Carbonic anhydrase n=1 Tax=Penicillium citrinum TaxID=5077 RepID=A0A9W9TQN3_PENCI|nr:uncharacterized protein N7469_005265 [Penicillium citrinum]KAJ5233499.1 hypothetical protein N7469_005265 [Penicillium citrinum]
MRVFTLVFSLLITVATSQTHDDGAETINNSPGHSSSFGYTGLEGPLNWYGLDRKHNGLCAKGRYQSPININSEIHSGRGGISIQIPSASADFENLGTTVEVALSNGLLFTPTGRYNLAQFHFHTPSEHRIHEEEYPLEVHFVFKNPAGRVAVVGFVFEITENRRGNALFENIFSQVHKIASPGTSVRLNRLMFGDLAAHLESNPVYQYSGSLTTPPCTEGVSWFVSSKPLALSTKMFNAIKHVLKFNARYTQNALGEKNLLEVAASELDLASPELHEPVKHELR